MRDYLIDNDRAKLEKLVADGLELAEIRNIMAKSGEGVTPRAFDAYVAGTPAMAKKLGVECDAPAAPAPKPAAVEPEAPKARKNRRRE